MSEVYGITSVVNYNVTGQRSLGWSPDANSDLAGRVNQTNDKDFERSVNQEQNAINGGSGVSDGFGNAFQRARESAARAFTPPADTPEEDWGFTQRVGGYWDSLRSRFGSNPEPAPIPEPATRQMNDAVESRLRRQAQQQALEGMQERYAFNDVQSIRAAGGKYQQEYNVATEDYFRTLSDEYINTPPSNPDEPSDNISTGLPSRRGTRNISGNDSLISAAMGSYLGGQIANNFISANRPIIGAQSYLPDQVAFEEGTSLAVAGASAIGGVIGGVIGKSPQAAIAGATMAGTAAGLAKGVADDWASSHKFAEERGGMALGLGSVTGTVDEFTKALQNASGSLSEVSQIAQMWGKSTQVGLSGVTAMGQLSQGLGVQFMPDMEATGTFLSSSPFYANAMREAGVVGFNRQDWGIVGEQAALHGDFGAMVASYQAEGAVGTPPKMRDQIRASLKEDHPGWTDWQLNTAESFTAWAGNQPDLKALPLTPNQDRAEREGYRDYFSMMQADAAVTVAQSQMGVVQSQMGYGLALGRGASAMQNALPGIQNAAVGVVSATQGQIDTINNDIARNQGIINSYQTTGRTPGQVGDPLHNATVAQAAIDADQKQIADKQQQQFQAQVTAQQTAQQAAMMDVQQNVAQYSEMSSYAGAGVAYAMFGGGSVNQISSAMGARVEADTKAAQYSISAAQNTPFMDPSTRASMMAQGYSGLASAAQEQYQQTMFGPTMQAAWSGIAVGTQQNIAAQAQTYGSPDTAAQAIREEVPKLYDQLGTLIDKYDKASATDRPGIYSEMQRVQKEIMQNPSVAATMQYQGDVSINRSMAGYYGGMGNVNTQYFGTSAASVQDYLYAANMVGNAATYDLGRANAKDANPQQQAEAANAYMSDVASQYAYKMQAAAITPTPQMETAVTVAQGNLQRLSYGFALPGNRQDAVLAIRSAEMVELQNFRTKEAEDRKKFANDPQLAAMEKDWAATEQGLMNNIAQTSYQSDMMFGQNLPTMIIGGTSRTVRDMPSMAQTAKFLEQFNAGTTAARNFGFFDTASGSHATANSGGYLANGQSMATAQPGNQSAQAIAGSATTIAHMNHVSTTGTKSSDDARLPWHPQVNHGNGYAAGGPNDHGSDTGTRGLVTYQGSPTGNAAQRKEFYDNHNEIDPHSNTGAVSFHGSSDAKLKELVAVIAAAVKEGMRDTHTNVYVGGQRTSSAINQVTQKTNNQSGLGTLIPGTGQGR